MRPRATDHAEPWTVAPWGPRVFSRPKTSATPPLFEEPNWSSCGQDEASKLYRETERTRGDLISVVFIDGAVSA